MKNKNKIPKPFIGLAGNIGVGKTTFTKTMSERCGWQPFYESVSDNPYLNDFYKDMKKWAFHSQMYFLSHKFKLHMGLNNSAETIIQDRTIYEDAEIFATNLYRSRKLNKRDYDTYFELYETMKNALQPPDLLI